MTQQQAFDFDVNGNFRKNGYNLEKIDTYHQGIIVSDKSGFIKLYEGMGRVSVYVTDIESLARICEEVLKKKLTWKEGKALYFIIFN